MTESTPPGRKHYYHAEAKALDGTLTLPLQQVITPQASAHLDAGGGYISQNTGDFRVGTAISYRSATTQVAGNPSSKPGHGWSTLATSTVEGLNIVDVLTADRIVAQVSTDHPLDGYTPTISFLGTQFDNLRIAGHPVTLKLNQDICGPKPGGDKPYFQDAGFMQRVHKQCSDLCAFTDLPPAAKAQYQKFAHGSFSPAVAGGPVDVECSLVTEATGDFPGKSFGHVIVIPNFGTIYLATVSVRHEMTSDHPSEPKTPCTTIGLTMVSADMGCLVHGQVAAARMTTNGSTKP